MCIRDSYQAVDRRDADDLASAAPRHHVLRHEPRAVETAVEVRVNNPIPVLERNLQDGLPADDPGVVHENVEAAEARQRCRNKLLGLGVCADVGLDGLRVATALPD